MTDGTSVNYVPNNLNQYATVGAESPSYNPNSDLTGYGGWLYTFDADNRLISATSGEHSVQFVYDGLGRCVQRTIDVVVSVFTYDGWNPIAEWNASGGFIAWNLYGARPDEILMRYQPTSASAYLHYHTDQFGIVAFRLLFVKEPRKASFFPVARERKTAFFWTNSGVSR